MDNPQDQSGRFDKEKCMSYKSFLAHIFGLLILFFPIVGSASEVSKVWDERLPCGNVVYEIQSKCVKAENDMSLNKCEPQTLKVTSLRSSASFRKLPHLNQHDKSTIKKAGGEIGSLFVTKWACGHSDKVHVAVLYYSTGGGSADYSETISGYDETGVIIQDDRTAKYRKAFQDGFQHLIPIHSIMPD